MEMDLRNNYFCTGDCQPDLCYSTQERYSFDLLWLIHVIYCRRTLRQLVIYCQRFEVLNENAAY